MKTPNIPLSRMLALAGIVLVLVVTFASPAGAVDTLQVTSPDPVLEQRRWTEFDRSSGLTRSVRDIFEDGDGNIWFATDQGAQRYDGLHWTTYTTRDGLADNRVRTIIQTRDGAMWFGTWRGGISRLDGEAWTTYTADDGLANNVIFWRGLVQARDGSLWAGFWSPGATDTTGTQAGISRFDGETWTTVEVPGAPLRLSVLVAYEASDSSIWFTTYGQGVLRFDGTGWTRYTTEEGLAGNSVDQMMESREGSLWFACFGDGISRFDGKQWRTYTAKDGLPEGTSFVSIWQKEDGTVWAGGSGGTLCRLEGERWKAYTGEETPLSGATVGQPLQDGVIWIYDWGTEKAFRFTPTSTEWTTFALEDSLSGASPAPDGSVWFWTRSGAVRYDGVHWLRYTRADGLLNAPIYSMRQTDDGSIWFLAGEFEKSAGVSRYQNGTWSRYTAEEIGLDDVEDIIRAKDGSFWFAGAKNGRSAASRYDGRTWRIYTDRDGLVGWHLRRVFQAENGDLWFRVGRRFKRGRPTATGEEDDGVLRYDGKSWTSYTTENGLSHNRGYGVPFQSPDGTVWVGTYAGVNWFDGEVWRGYTYEEGLPALKPRGFVGNSGDLWFCYQPTYSAGVTRYDGKEWKTYTTRDGLVDNRVSTIYRATDGALWFATIGGVSRFDGESWTGYTVEDGLPGNDIRVIWESPEGVFWFGAADGKVGRFSPDNVGPETTIEPAIAEVSSAGNILLRWSGRDLWDGTLPRDLRYQWRMDGAEWSPWSERADFTFTALSSGGHTFEVRAVDRDMNADASPAVHAFVVEAPWWQNPWMIGGAVVLLGLVGVQTGRVVRRDRRLRESNSALSEANKEMLEVNRELQEKTGELEQKTEGLDKSNRELTVEAALERVRAKALGMEQSEEIAEVAAALFLEYRKLGLPSIRSGITVIDDDAGEMEIWLTRQEGEAQPSSRLPLSDVESPEAQAGLAAWRQQEDPYVVFEMDREQVVELSRMVEEGAKGSGMEFVPPEGDDWPEQLQAHWVFFKQGILYLTALESLSEDELAVAGRFAEVFDFAYTRLLELQEKEERARDAERQAAVDRVRAEAAGMQKSDEIVRVVVALWTALKDVGLVSEACAIQIVNSEAGVLTLYTPQKPGLLPANKVIQENILEGIHLYATDIPLEFAREKGYAMPGVERGIGATDETFPEDVRQIWFGDTPPGDVPDLSFLIGLDLLNVSFADGGIVVFAPKGHRYTPQDLQTVIEFADGVSLGLTRFLDFQRLEAQNRAMSDANKELFQANRALQRDSAVERIRGEVQAMEQASDFERVLSVLAEDLKTVGLSFDTCGIDVLDEPVDEPTMAYFEEHGFQYTTYTIDPEGRVVNNSYHIPAPFPPVNLETIERFIAGEPWKALIGGTNAILEVPASNYGRLRITSSERQDFTEEDIASLQDFAAAIALGYARYLDIREIQEQTERKSRFLANMSHELRTPMNAIIGFTRMVLRREKNISERNRENLKKVRMSADHLLNLINGILNLSKIESGQTDVTVERFDVKGLVASCCAEVEPLVEAKPGLKLEYTVSEDVGEANTDPGRLRQIVINLLSNAIKFTDQGEVAVRVSKDGLAGEEASLALAVSDTGTGIPADALESIFEEFQQVKGSDPQQKGTGLGLPITKGFAELLGGTIGVQSEVGKGSTFTVRVPVVYEEG